MLATIKNFAPLTVYLIGIFFVTFLSLRGKISTSLLFLVPLFPLRNVVERLYIFPLGNNLDDIIMVAMILGWIIRSISRREKLLVHTPFNKLLFIMAIYTYISLWWGSSYLGIPAPLNFLDHRLQNWKSYMVFPLLYLIVVNNVKDIRQIKKLFFAMICAMILMEYYVVQQILWSSGLASRDRMHGTFVWLGPNETAAFFSTYIFVLIGIFMCERNRKLRFVLAGVIAFAVYCVVFLFSRGSYLAILTGFILIALFKNKKILVPILLLLIFWQVVFPPQVIERLQETVTNENTLDESSQLRVNMWQQSLDLAKQNLIFGIGYNTIWYMGLQLGDTHNMYLKILTEQGMVGLFIFLLCLFLAIKHSWRLFNNSNDNFLKGLGIGFAICVVATMVTNIFGDRWTHLSLGAFFWVFLGMVQRGNIIVQNSKASTPSSARV